jgi:outer membrane protein assembly factor BamB
MWQKSAAALGVLRDAIPDGFGGVLVVANFLSDFDGVTGIEIWRTDLSATWDTKFAIRQDGRIFLSPAGALSSEILALQPTTGAVVSRTVLPTGINASINTDCIQGADFFSPESPVSGPLAIDSDGTVAWEAAVGSSTASWFCPQGQPIVTISSSFQLSLFRLSMDGTLSRTSLTTQGAVPGNVIPDGRGGWLATWTASDPSVSHPLTISHFDPQGSSEYILNQIEGSDFPRNRDLVLGEDGVAFATDFSKIVAFNLTSGQVLWTYQAPATTVSLIASSAGNGLVAKLTDYQSGIETVVRFDSTGQPTFDTWSAKGIDYEIGDQWHTFPSTGSGFPALSAAPIEWSSSIGSRPDQNLTNAATPGITVRVARVMNASLDQQLTNAQIQDRVQQAVNFWKSTSQILLNWDGNVEQTPACAPDQPLCSTGNLYDITDVSQNGTTFFELTRRFKKPKGLQLIFCFSAAGSTAQGITVGVIDSSGKTTSFNISAIGKDAQGLVTAHEIGHIFQLPHVFSPFNLMCGSAGGFFCPEFPSNGIRDDQIRDARRFAWTLADEVRP